VKRKRAAQASAEDLSGARNRAQAEWYLRLLLRYAFERADDVAGWREFECEPLLVLLIDELGPARASAITDQERARALRARG
jgi:hypothetical protein